MVRYSVLPGNAVWIMGLVLVADGQLRDGVEMLRESVWCDELPNFRSNAWAGLAIAEVQGEDVKAARRRLGTARKLWPASPGLQRIEDQIARID